jgi:glycosyltransferase involved in cell wall biosynthesis
VAVVGALSGEKRPALGIEVVRKIPSAWLVLAGGGPLQPEVERLAADSLAGRSVVLGPVGDVRSVLAAANVVLVCSATEGMPGVVIEAALMGRRVVVPAVGACPTMISEGLAGALVSADADAEDVASAVRTQLALADPPPNPAWSLQPAVGRWSALLRRLAQREVQERL